MTCSENPNAKMAMKTDRKAFFCISLSLQLGSQHILLFAWQNCILF